MHLKILLLFIYWFKLVLLIFPPLWDRSLVITEDSSILEREDDMSVRIRVEAGWTGRLLRTNYLFYNM